MQIKASVSKTEICKFLKMGSLETLGDGEAKTSLSCYFDK